MLDHVPAADRRLHRAQHRGAQRPRRSGPPRHRAVLVADIPDDQQRLELRPDQRRLPPVHRAKPPPACGDQRSAYQPNAFYCPAGDFIAWDAQTLIPQLQSRLRAAAGRGRHGPRVRPRRAEPARHARTSPRSCWNSRPTASPERGLADVLAGRSTAFPNVTPAQLDNTLARHADAARPARHLCTEPAGAHGNAFDRIRAFQDGVQNRVPGPVRRTARTTCRSPRCRSPPRRRPRPAATCRTTQAVQLLAEDAAGRTGRAPIRDSAGQPWQTLRVEPFDTGVAAGVPGPRTPSAGGAAFYCPDGDFVAFDNERLGPELYQRIGDNAVGMLIGDLFARAAQDRRGASTQDRAGQLTVDCLAGSWTNDLLTARPDRAEHPAVARRPGRGRGRAARLRPGHRAERATAFDRIAAYRKACLGRLGRLHLIAVRHRGRCRRADAPRHHEHQHTAVRMPAASGHRPQCGPRPDAPQRPQWRRAGGPSAATRRAVTSVDGSPLLTTAGHFSSSSARPATSC